MPSSTGPSCKSLVLDAGPLLTLSPLRGLAEKYLTVPQVLDELKDRHAREHFEQLGLSAGVQIEIRSPDTASLTKVIEFAKKTGDYSVLSHADLCVLALTLNLDMEERTLAEANAESLLGDTSEVEEALDKLGLRSTNDDKNRTTATSTSSANSEGAVPMQHNSAEAAFQALAAPPPEEITKGEKIKERSWVEDLTSTDPDEPLYDDPSDEDDGEGAWITPSNVAVHKSRALDLLPSSSTKRGKKQFQERVLAGCMTADFAMQNVLLQMGLSLVGTEGKRIERVKTWVLRCHACFKICKDASKKFCPSCGNPTLLRTSVTIASPDAGPKVPAMQVHLKKNFQYRLRGTVYSIPAPKPGSAKTGTGDGLILREDQSEYMRAQKIAESKRVRDERKMMSGALAAGAKGDAGGVRVGSWMDPDWMPEMITVGAGGKGRTNARAGEMPVIGYGKRNPNERRRRK